MFCGLLYDTHAPGYFDFGSERSAFRGEFRYYRAEGPVDLDYYVLIADTLELVRGAFPLLRRGLQRRIGHLEDTV